MERGSVVTGESLCTTIVTVTTVAAQMQMSVVGGTSSVAEGLHDAGARLDCIA